LIELLEDIELELDELLLLEDELLDLIDCELLPLEDLELDSSDLEILLELFDELLEDLLDSSLLLNPDKDPEMVLEILFKDPEIKPELLPEIKPELLPDIKPELALNSLFEISDELDDFELLEVILDDEFEDDELVFDPETYCP